MGPLKQVLFFAYYYLPLANINEFGYWMCLNYLLTNYFKKNYNTHFYRKIEKKMSKILGQLLTKSLKQKH